jgi:YbbR domain-containing protein
MPRVHEIVLHNRGLKLAAVALAVITWYAVREATSFESRLQDVRMEILLDEGWAVMDRSVSEVDVLFRGSQGDIRLLDRTQVRVTVDLRGRSKPGTSKIAVHTADVVAPGGARAVYVDPGEVTLTLDREADRLVPVKADIVGELPAGSVVESVSTEPAAVVVHGPERRLEAIDVVSTETIDLAGRLRSFEVSRPIRNPGGTWSARVDPDRVKVRVTIEEHTTQTNLAAVRVAALVPQNRAAAVAIVPPEVSVQLRGPADVIEAMDRASVRAYVDCEALEPGQRLDLPVRLATPPGVEAVAVEPPSVEAEMQFAPP